VSSGVGIGAGVGVRILRGHRGSGCAIARVERICIRVGSAFRLLYLLPLPPRILLLHES